MLRVLGLLFGLVPRFFHARRDLLLENLALRQQLLTFQRRKSRPKLGLVDRLFWVMARRLWLKWKQALMYVTPETVARWHRAGFRLYWSWLSRHRKVLGRKSISKQVRDLIFQMVAENHTWGAPHIHGRTVETRLRCFRTHHLPLDAKSAEKSRTGATLESIPSQS